MPFLTSRLRTFLFRRGHAAPGLHPVVSGIESGAVIISTTRASNPNQRAGSDVICNICAYHGGETEIPIAKVTASCQGLRTICRQCLVHHINASVEKGVVDNITCHCGNRKCNVVLGFHDIKQALAADDFARYDRLVLHRYLEAQPEFCWCAHTGCGSGQLHISRTSNPVMRCKECGHSTCFTHHCAWHTGRTCAQYDQDAQVSDEVRLLQALDCRRFKRCPSAACGHMIEKNRGCHHMTCRCKHEFCWHCLAPYDGPDGVRVKGHRRGCVHHG